MRDVAPRLRASEVARSASNRSRRSCDEVVADILTVVAEGDGRLAQFMDLTLIGDIATLHLALDLGVDPGPIPVLDDIKKRLRQS